MVLAIATGTRADWGLLSPLATELRNNGFQLRIWATNMHANPSFGNSLDEIAADGFQPQLIGRYEGEADKILASNIVDFGKAMDKDKPNTIIILGDRIEMLGVASAAMLRDLPIIHIAGGTVSEGAVDNVIRDSITRMASLHLTETEGTASRLHSIGVPGERVHICGGLGIYNALNRKLMTRVELSENLDFDLGKRLLVGTLHAATRPVEGEEPLQAMHSMLAALGDWLQEDSGNRIILTWPNNDVDPTPQIEALEDFKAHFPVQVKVVPSLGALRYLSAVKLSCGVVGNSSSGLVEVPSLGVPTLDIGSRQKGRECGPSVIHCAPDKDSITRGLKHILSPDFQAFAKTAPNPYARPETPRLMVEAISDFLKN